MSLSRPILKYPEEKLTQALHAISNGMKIREASRLYGVPRGTIQDRLHLRVPQGPRRMGPGSILSKQEESEIADWCMTLAKCGFPLKLDNLLNTVQSIMLEDGRPNPFKNSRPGKKWLQAFFRRNPKLSLRTPEGITKGRAVITEESIRKWFNELQEYLTSISALDILNDPQRIFNGDETSFILCPKTGKVIAPRGYKNVYQIIKGKEKEAVTVLAFFSANGDILPPCVVFPYIRPPKDVVNSMPDDWFLGKSDTGWMKAEIFFDYISKGLDKWIKDNNIKKPVLVFVDGHKSHMTKNLSQYCYDNNIILYALPPNTTHMMQPADVSVFKPFKSDWTSTIHEWSSQPENVNNVLTKSTFCPLLNKVLSKPTLKDSIKNGFRKCGLSPFDPNAVDYTKCVQNHLENIKTKACTSNKSPNKSIKKREFAIASKVINHLKNDLTASGIDVTCVLQIIEDAKVNQGLNDSASSSIPDEVTKNSRNETQERVEKIMALEHKNDIVECDKINIREQQENDDKISYQNLNTTEDSLLNLGDLTFLNNNLSDDGLELMTFEVSEESILIPVQENVQATEEANQTVTSDIISIPKAIIQTQKLSPVVKKHLVVPSPIKKSTVIRDKNRIGAISSIEWRLFEQKKDDEKQKKKHDIEQRKLQRQKIREQKENLKKNKQKKITRKKTTTRRISKTSDSDADLPIIDIKKKKMEYLHTEKAQTKKANESKDGEEVTKYESKIDDSLQVDQVNQDSPDDKETEPIRISMVSDTEEVFSTKKLKKRKLEQKNEQEKENNSKHNDEEKNIKESKVQVISIETFDAPKKKTKKLTKKIDIVSNYRVKPKTYVLFENKPLQKAINRKMTFRNEKELEDFINNEGK